MKDKIVRYKAQYDAMPEPLQKQILIRLGFALAFFLLFILVLCMMFDWLTTIPFVAISLYSLMSAGALFIRTANKEYVVVRGRCVETEVTLIRKRSKSILIETEEHMVRVTLRQRLRRIPQGTYLEVYVANNAQVYERDGVKLLYTYLAVEYKGGIGRDEKSNRSIPDAETD